ncbi:MAG: hypothetical protein RLN76_12160 [Phycisphaeraceae bacterium]
MPRITFGVIADDSLPIGDFTPDVLGDWGTGTVGGGSYRATITELSGFFMTDPGVTGDFNGDTLVDALDIDLLTAAIRDASIDSQFDLDASGLVDAGDLDNMIDSVLSTVPGDANLDRTVDLIDLSALASNFDAQAG